MKTRLFLLGLLLIPVVVLSQSKFGNATKEELEMVTYDKDTTAAAVVLHKKGRLRFVTNNLTGNFQYEYVEEKKIKILKAEGLEYANKVIDYYEESRTWREDVKNLSGTTYNLEGGKVVKTKLSKANIFDEDVEGKWKRKKITMPAAKVGSVIEYKYTILSDYTYELKDFFFQESIPVAYVDLEVVIPEYYNYNLSYQGYIRMDETKTEAVNEQFFIRYEDSSGRPQSFNHSCTAKKYVFRGSSVPPAKDEPMLWTVRDYISKVTFELQSTNFPGSFVKPFTTNWESVDKKLMDDGSFGGNLKRSGWFKDDVVQGEQTVEVAAGILNMIKNKVQWNEKYSLFSSNPRKALNEGVGSSADMNFLLINALKAGGFDAFPVVLSTRANGRIPISHPSISSFNYVITGITIGDKNYFTDASSKFSSWNLLPEKCMVDRARIMAEGGGSWVDLSKISTGTILKTGTVKFEDGSSIFAVKETAGGNLAYNARANYSKYDSEEKYIQNFEEENNSTVQNFVLTGHEYNSTEPFTAEYTELRNVDLGDFIYYTPPLSKIYRENPLKAETRMFPINFDFTQNFIQMLTIEVPEGYEVVEMPKSEHLVLNDKDLSFIYTVSQEEGKINIQTRYLVRNLLFLPTDYDYLKDFIAKMINKQSEQIVLKKI